MSQLQQTVSHIEYVVDIDTEVAPFLHRWAALLNDRSSPFHALPWLSAWYATLGNTPDYKPLLVGVRRSDTGADVMLLPLVSHRQRGLSVVEFADATVMDYTSPLVAPDWAGASSPCGTAAVTASAELLWKSLRHALRGHDVLQINKMLSQALDENLHDSNPLLLALRPRLQVCDMFGNQFHADDDWEVWSHSRDKRVRKEFARSWRVFTRSATARFERVTEPQDALALFEQLEHQQTQRMDQLDYNYVLNQPAYRAFYRQALMGGLADGSVVLTALRDGNALAAAQFGVANRHRYIALRLTMGGDEWKASSPGRLLCEHTAQHLHAQGLRWFDFGIGDYRHKQMFGVSHIALVDGCEALSWRGVPITWAWRLRRALKRQHWLVSLVRRLKSKTVLHT